MKFAFDLDETITAAPKEFAAIINSLMDAGHEVYIITYRDEHWRKQTEAELKSYGIKKWTHCYITGEKDKLCAELGIDLAIDDCSAYHYPNFWRFTMGFVLPKKEGTPWMKKVGSFNTKMSAGYTDSEIMYHFQNSEESNEIDTRSAEEMWPDYMFEDGKEK